MQFPAENLSGCLGPEKAQDIIGAPEPGLDHAIWQDQRRSRRDAELLYKRDVLIDRLGIAFGRWNRLPRKMGFEQIKGPGADNALGDFVGIGVDFQGIEFYQEGDFRIATDYFLEFIVETFAEGAVRIGDDDHLGSGRLPAEHKGVIDGNSRNIDPVQLSRVLSRYVLVVIQADDIAGKDELLGVVDVERKFLAIFLNIDHPHPRNFGVSHCKDSIDAVLQEGRGLSDGQRMAIDTPAFPGIGRKRRSRKGNDETQKDKGKNYLHHNSLNS
jgi:hypothetical protein